MSVSLDKDFNMYIQTLTEAGLTQADATEMCEYLDQNRCPDFRCLAPERMENQESLQSFLLSKRVSKLPYSVEYLNPKDGKWDAYIIEKAVLGKGTVKKCRKAIQIIENGMFTIRPSIARLVFPCSKIRRKTFKEVTDLLNSEIEILEHLKKQDLSAVPDLTWKPFLDVEATTRYLGVHSKKKKPFHKRHSLN